MAASTGKPPTAPLIVWWVIWVSLLAGVIVIGTQFGDFDSTVSNIPWFIALPPLFMGMLIRFIVLPRATARRKAFPLFIVGLAMCESTGLLSVFLVTENRPTLLLLSLLGIVIYMPTFVRKIPAA